ncbi:MAG: hypothetical protein ACR2O2_12830 [Ruegeria sp.]
MNVIVAQAILLENQRDWRKPHLSWLPPQLYSYKKLPKLILRRRR